MSIFRAITLLACFLTARLASAATVDAVWNSAADVPVTVDGYTATGNTVSFTLNFAPATGTDFMVISNAGLPFISGTFDNLAQGQGVALSYRGVTYRFVANYYGGSGNDLVLVWASTRAFNWGDVSGGPTCRTPAPAPATGVLAGKTVLALAGSYSHSMALCSDGTVAAWGGGTLGDNTHYNSLVPVAVNSDPGVSALYGKRVVAIAAGGGHPLDPLHNHSLALCSDGTVATWGPNDYGELGDGTTLWRIAPVAVSTGTNSALYGKTVVAIATGHGHSLALCSDGTVAAWGGPNNQGQLGDGSQYQTYLVPVAVNTGTNSALYGKTVVAIAAGALHSLALCSDGTVAAWGHNYYGQLGDNQPSGYVSLLPVAASTSTNSALCGKTVVAIAAGAWHSLALCSDGTVVTWGRNEYGQLGNNTLTNQLVPVAVNTDPNTSALYGKTVVAITAGNRHNLALCSNGTVVAWGYNRDGQLGDNTTTNRLVPVEVNTLQFGAAQRFAGVASSQEAYFSLALVTAPPASEIILASAQTLTNGSFQFSFTNTPGAFFGVVTATNPGAPLSDWASLTGLTEVAPGQFEFTDPQAINSPRRFYRVRSP